MRKSNWLPALAAVLCLTVTHAQDTAAPELSREALEAFLRDADLSDFRDAGGGVTGSQRATASDDQMTHDVHVQNVDISRDRFIVPGAEPQINFRDTYIYNVAAYRLAALLGLDNVPVSVSRTIAAVRSSVTWWVDDVAMTEKERIAQNTLGPNPAETSREFYAMYVFDELIRNSDRNQGNMLWTTDWKLWLIDHTRAFRADVELDKPERMVRIDRALLDNLRGLTAESLEEALDGSLTGRERSNVIKRRDLLVQHFDTRIAQLGESLVVMDE